jgi:RsiW-degrading membrane proteinase PrsW (M82 family)
VNGIFIFLLLILAAAFPAVVVFLWFQARKFPLGLPWFLLSLAAGIISLLAAALIQKIIPPSSGNGLGWIFFGFFVRIALVEEASRLVTLVPLLEAGKRRLCMDESFSAALGLAAGLGFAAIENAFYGTADVNITLLRAFTAAPLHAACGIRIGTAVFAFKNNPSKAFFLFVTAVLIHGAYNLIIVSPAFPSALPLRAAFVVFFAFAALFTALPRIREYSIDEKRLS